MFQKIDHFLPGHPKKSIFHKNLEFFSRNFSTLMLGTLCLLMIPHINQYLMIQVVIFLESFEGLGSDGDYLFSTVLPCLVFFQLSGFNVQTYMKHNLFGTIRSIIRSNPYYNMVFEYYSDSCDTMYYIKTKFFLKNVIYLLLFLAYQFNIDF